MRYNSQLFFSKRYPRLAFVLLGIVAFNMEGVQAQNVNRTGTPQGNSTPSLTAPQSPAPLPSQGKVAPSPNASRPLSATETFTVKRFNIIRNTKFSSQKLSTLLTPYTNRPITVDELREACGRITNYYADHGYFKAYAYVPAQNFQGDALTIQVVESGHPDGL